MGRLEEKDNMIEGLQAEIIMLKKLLDGMENDYMDREKELRERSEEIRVKLERTENMFQSKPLLM